MKSYFHIVINGTIIIPKEAEKAGCIKKERGWFWFKLLEQKKRILLNNIFGVDIDKQAVEVTQLSLFLKLLENESISTH